MNNYLFIIPGVALAGVAALWPKKKIAVANEVPELVTRFSDRVASPELAPTGVPAMPTHDLHLAEQQSTPTPVLDLNSAVNDVLSDLQVRSAPAAASVPWATDAPAPADVVSEVTSVVTSAAAAVDTEIEHARSTASTPVVHAEERAVPAWATVQPEAPSLSQPDELRDEFDETRDDLPAEETGTFIPSWRPPVEQEEEEQVFFGSQPLTADEREAARQRWIAQNGEVRAITTTTSEHLAETKEEAPSAVLPWSAEAFGNAPEFPAPAESVTQLSADIASGASIDDAIDRIVREAASSATLCEIYAGAPECRYALIHALDGVTPEIAMPVLSSAVREYAEPDIAWTALTLLKKLRGATDAYGDVIEGALQGEPGVAARAATILLGDASQAEYEEFLRSRLDRAQAQTILDLMSPVLAA